MLPRLSQLNPLRWLHNRGFTYQQLPSDSSFHLQRYAERWSTGSDGGGLNKIWSRRTTVLRLVFYFLIGFVVLSLLGGGGYHQVRKHRKPSGKGGGGGGEELAYSWQHYSRLNGFYNGLRTLVPSSEYTPENRWNHSSPAEQLSAKDIARLPKDPPLDPVQYNPYESLQRDYKQVKECYLDEAETMAAPDVYAYPGLPQNMTLPFYGSYGELGLEQNMCFERFGRLGPYGYGYDAAHGGLGPGLKSENAGSKKVFKQTGYLNYSKVDWGIAQKKCYEKNKQRFEGKNALQRQAYVLRAWVGFKYTEYQLLTMRAMINELALKSGGEYDVHLLLHVKDNSIPIWASKELYQETLQQNVPREFWNMTTLGSEKQMEVYYPEPFPDNFANMAGSNLHGVYRSAHFPLQWFAQQHPEYEFFWNWEMDLRYSGHYYELNTKAANWARKQPRKGLWERGKRFWIPEYHGDWKNFTAFVEQETIERDISENDLEKSGPVPIWGPVQNFPHTGMLTSPNGTEPPTTWEEDDYQWGVGEDADLIVFNPLFDPSLTNWVFSWDVTGYNRSLPIPPRRAAIITVARLSRRLLQTMHDEVWQQKHTMFPEMWPPSVAFHHGLKAVYVPHPVYFDRDWDVSDMNQRFNYPKEIWESPFGWGENNFIGSSFYYNSGFSGALWRRWLGQAENKEGGRQEEEAGSGRMCLRGMLHHPIKHEDGPVD
ncbi:hypothetical protein KC332_g1797 [Hortaea werneckii]|nr:hypothetical protein KC332_g1797 [Hortaea werneckii]